MQWLHLVAQTHSKLNLLTYSHSDKVLCQLLNEMDGIEGREKVVIFGATNRPDILDKALIRPGRFDRLIYIPPPDAEARKEIFKINVSKMSVDEDIILDVLAEYSKNFSGAEINLACREAGMMALNENINAERVCHRHFRYCVNQISPVITKEMLDYFEKFKTKNEF
jgi:transitional endoplasmic reticulum ATPase